MNIEIKAEPPDNPDAVVLIEELEAVLEPHYPSTSRHGYSVQKLIDQKVLFFIVRVDNQPAGCGGVQLFRGENEPPFGEVKRMYVRPAYRGLGLGKKILQHLEAVVRAHQMAILRLETGIYQAAAIQLYEEFGFRRIPPFGSYFEDPLSRCYEKTVAP